MADHRLRTGGHEASRPAWVSDAWDEYVKSLSELTRSEFSDIRTTVTVSVMEPLVRSVQRIGDAYTELVGGLAAGGEAESIGPLDLAALRKAAATQISGPLLESVQAIDAPAVVAQTVIDSMERLRRVAQQAPEQIVLPDEPEIYLPSQVDAFPTRLHKVWLRSSRRLRSLRDSAINLALRIARRRQRPATPPARVVALRELLCFHVDRRLVGAALQTHETLQQSVARCYARLECSSTEWSFGLLEADDEFGVDDRVTLNYGRDTEGAREGGSDDETSEIDIKGLLKATEWLGGEEIDLQLDQLEGRFDQAIAEVEDQLLADLMSAGTPLLRAGGRALTKTGSPAVVQQLGASRDRWIRWYQQMANRLALNHSVLMLRETLADRAEQILRDIKNATLVPILAAFDEAEHLIDAARLGLDRAFSSERQETVQLADALRTVGQQATDGVGRTFGSAVAREAQSFLTDPGIDHWKELTILVTQLPGDLMVHQRSRAVQEEVDPGKRPFAINLREIATNALSPPWPTLLSEAAEPLKAGITRAWVGAEKLQHVIDYNLSAAIDELVGADEAERDAEASRTGAQDSPTVSPRATAVELATDAVRRSGELVEELRASLMEPWSEFTRKFGAAVHDDWQDLISQVKSDDVMMERWVGMRTRALRQVERTQDRVELLWKRGVSTAKQRAGVIRRFATQLLRRGRSAVGVVDAAEEAESTIAEALQGAEQVRKALPLVYRRLFAFEALTDESLLEGRARDLVSVRKRFERWKRSGGTGTVVLAAPLGSGKTSFLEVLRLKVFDQCNVKILHLQERLDDAEQLIAALCGVLDTPIRAVGLPQLEIALTQPMTGAQPLVVVIDNLEHVMLQSAGGTDLLQLLLGMTLRTDHAVFWLATVSDEAWRYARVSASASTASIGTYSLAPLDREQVEDVVLGRHHRSGMTLRFLAPEEPSPLLKRRLRRAQTRERQQQILQELFFDGLNRQSGNDLTLAMLYWLRSVEFQDDGDVVAVRPLQPIDFSELRNLDLIQLFTLRAFVVHNTLTAAELGMILRVLPDRSGLILESLINLALIERVHTDGATKRDTLDTAVDRFRLSRVVLHPVRERLRSAHIIY